MELKINIEKKHMYILSVLIILIGGMLFVQGQGVNNFGHDSEDIYVDVGGGGIKTLQSAVSAGDFGSLVTINAIEKTLQEAIDDDSIATSDDLVSSGSVGVGQNWANVESSRASNVLYTNNKDRPIMVVITGDESYNSMDGCELNFYVDSKKVYEGRGSYASCDISIIIPSGSTYKAHFVEGMIHTWFELK